MPPADPCRTLREWLRRYPEPSASDEQNTDARAHEDRWLARFAGQASLDRDQAIELVKWKFQSMPNRQALALKGISSERWEGHGGAAELIRQALAANSDYDALALMARSGSGIGIYRFGPAMSSVVLAACRPDRFTVADSRALKALRGLGLMTDGPLSFRLDDWLPYLDACRSLARQCGVSLRDVDRALWVGAADLR